MVHRDECPFKRDRKKLSTVTVTEFYIKGQPQTYCRGILFDGENMEREWS